MSSHYPVSAQSKVLKDNFMPFIRSMLVPSVCECFPFLPLRSSSDPSSCPRISPHRPPPSLCPLPSPIPPGQACCVNACVCVRAVSPGPRAGRRRPPGGRGRVTDPRDTRMDGRVCLQSDAENTVAAHHYLATISTHH